MSFWFTWKAVLVIISILLSLFSLLSLFPDFSENDLIKNMELLFLKKVPWGLQRSPSRKVACLYFPCSLTDLQVSPLAKMACLKKNSTKYATVAAITLKYEASVDNKLCLQSCLWWQFNKLGKEWDNDTKGTMDACYLLQKLWGDVLKRMEYGAWDNSVVILERSTDLWKIL